MTPRTAAAAIFRAAVDAVDPRRLVTAHLALRAGEVVVHDAGGGVARWRPPVRVVGAGKAAARMAEACEQVLGDALTGGIVVVADGCGLPLRSIKVVEAAHPLPDVRSERAAQHILETVREGGEEGVLCLISGGASSLMALPRPPVTLDDKIQATRLLLECGASIEEISIVRKHISLIKGGGLLRAATASMAALILSDVPSDDPGTIGSGPTSADATTFADAWVVLERYGLTRKCPRAITRLLERGKQGLEAETVKPGAPESERCANRLVGSNRTALEGAAQEARRRGWTVSIEESPLVGDTTAAARRFWDMICERRTTEGSGRLCLVAGGETTVRVAGRGRGGRNQEFALALAELAAGTNVVVLSAGTDGVDGPTPAAGAFVDGDTLRRGREHGLDAAAALADNDSHTYFATLGDLLISGPTGTNVADVKIALLP